MSSVTSNLIPTLERSAALVKAWGAGRLPDGRTLEETLTVEGVPLWDVMAPTLAFYNVPKALSTALPRNVLRRHLRAYVSRVKHQVFDLVTRRKNMRGCSRWPAGEQTPVFLGFNAYMYRDILQPVCSELLRRGEQAIVLHDWRRFLNTAEITGGDELHSIWEHWDGEAQTFARQLGASYRRMRDALEQPALLAQLIRDEQGQPLWPQMEESFLWMLRAFLPWILPQIAVARHILRQHRPALLVTPESPCLDPHAQIYYALACQEAIPVLDVQFGVLSNEAFEYCFIRGQRIAAWSDNSRETFIAHEVPPEKIVITGSPRHDCMVNVSAGEVRHTRAKLGVPYGRKMALFASTYSVAAYSQMADPGILSQVKRAVCQVSGRMEGLCLVVKPHPLENVKETKRLAAGCPNIIFADKKSDIRELTRACDVFITLGSTATMDALIARKLVIWPAFPKLVWWDDQYLKFGAVLVAQDEEALGACLRQVVDGESEKILAKLDGPRNNLLRQWTHECDGQATSRVIALMRKMTGQRQAEPK
ncbi:MAG: CDP-glycerol glycerophosphotransferase family protein [Planctomycetota bacterium]